MEDMRHLQIFAEIAQELEGAIVTFNRLANGVTDKDRLLALRLEQNDLLLDLVKKHRRAMDFMQGKPYEPQMHFGEAVLLPVGGGGAG